MRRALLPFLMMISLSVAAQVDFALDFGEQNGISLFEVSEQDAPIDIACTSHFLYVLSNGSSEMDTTSQWVQVTRLMSATGAVDTSFADQGTLEFTFTPFPFSTGRGLVVDQQGSIHVFGTGTNLDSAIYRPVCSVKISTNGTLDSVYGVKTFSFIDAQEKVNNVTIHDTAIMVTGAAYERFTSVFLPAAARLDLKGNLDTSFVETGKAYINLWGGVFPFKTTHASGGEMHNSMPIDGDNWLFAGGHSNGDHDAAVVVKLFNNGELDSTFNTNGQLFVSPELNFDHFAKDLHFKADTMLMGLELRTDLERDLGLIKVDPDLNIETRWIDYAESHDDIASFTWPYVSLNSHLADTTTRWSILQFGTFQGPFEVHDFSVPSNGVSTCADTAGYTFVLGQIQGKIAVAALRTLVTSGIRPAIYPSSPAGAVYDLLGRPINRNSGSTIFLKTENGSVNLAK